MADKELRKMSRIELIEIIYSFLQKEEELKQEIERLHAELDERTIQIEKAGSIAEASLQLNHIFEAAQQAADQYLQSVLNMSDEQKAETLLENTKKQCREMQREAMQKCEILVEKTLEDCERLRNNATIYPEERWQIRKQRLIQMVEDSKKVTVENQEPAEESDGEA